jgi:hypothetical protein
MALALGLALCGGLVLAELHQPNDGAWPFFPGPDRGDLIGLPVFPPAPWSLHGALWLGVNHPVVQRLATLAGPADAVWILARLVLLSQELEPDDEAHS